MSRVGKLKRFMQNSLKNLKKEGAPVCIVEVSHMCPAGEVTSNTNHKFGRIGHLARIRSTCSKDQE